MSRLHVPIGLRWSDLDAYGHVNNVAMLRLLEEARVRTFWAMGGPAESEFAPSVAVLDAQPGSGTLSVIARQEVEYLAQVPYLQQPLDIQMWIGRLGGASAELCFEVCTPLGVEPFVLFARAAVTIVLVSSETGRPGRIPENVREAWQPYLEEPLHFAKRR